MSSILLKTLTMTLFFLVIFMCQSLAQLDKEYPSKIKMRHFFRYYNYEAEELNSFLQTSTTILRMNVILEKRHIEDSLNFRLSDKSDSNQNMYLNFTNGMKWRLPDGTPTYPDIHKRAKSKDYQIEDDPEALNWIFYMQILDYWKENKEFPYKVIQTYSCIDTLEFDNNTRFRFLLERQYKQDSLTHVKTEIFPLKQK